MILYLRHLARGGGDVLAQILRRKVPTQKRLVVDYSSPNIAKHFHVGNLRSTIVGEFFCKINRLAGNEVKSVNYLGDWGTQFALLAAYWPNSKAKIEFDSLSSNSSVRERLLPLMNGYVEAFEFAENNPDFRSQVTNSYLAEMENALIDGRDNNSALKLWREFRQLSCDYLDQFYANMKISFDHWDAESYHVPAARRMMEELIQTNQATLTKDGLWIVRDKVTDSYSVLRRSNESTLYLSRELAATLARDERFNADSYVYVVDLAQTSHFVHLKHLLKVVKREDLADKIVHLQFGRVIGMSTRRKRVELVEEVLDEGVKHAEKYIRKSKTMRVPEDEVSETCQELAEAALFINEFKRNKASNYTFFIDEAFQQKSRSFFLHASFQSYYSLEKYAKLCSLIENNSDLKAELRQRLDSDMSDLRIETDSCSRGMIQCLYELDGALFTSYSTSEASALLAYLHRLGSCVGSAISKLQLRHEPNRDVALNRMLLFMAAKNVMEEMFYLIGLKPLKRI
ncbi:Arginyl-tRNA synthetase [Aphelenchoides besseyi]|nr:Arginyl-tRNA synthetase [Aphelenchoides besseyi]KAI6227950.1 Arginyl-tRNA synthetase [Aphelenchoides besseyi]